MNIAIFTHNYPKDKNDRKDAGIFVYDFVRELKKYHKVYIFCPDYGNNQKFGNWSIYNPLNIINFFKNIFFGIRESLKFVKENKIDYILCAWAIPSGIYAFASNIMYKTRYGIWYLGSDLNIYSKVPILSNVMSMVSKKANNLFANSYSLVKIAKLKYADCEMMPASTKVDNINPKEIALNKNKINILYVGRLEKIKGPDLLVEAAKSLDSKFYIRIIGDGTMMNQFDKSQKNIEFLGQKGIEEISMYMRASDFLVIPSRNESLPLVILEGASYRLPILASNVGDCKYVIDKYQIGEIFTAGNVSQLIRKISKFDFKTFKKNGRFDDLVVDYSLKVSVKTFLKKL